MTRVATPQPRAPHALKIVVAGGFGVGKTTMVRSVSEIRPLHTEEPMSRAARIRRKIATTVALDFGRITLDGASDAVGGGHTVLHLFGVPGQERFWFLWDRIFSGTIGAVVLVDTRCLADAWPAIDRLEHLGMPFIVAANDFGGPFEGEESIRAGLGLGDDVPMVEFDARDHSSSKFVLIALVDHLRKLSGRRPT
ncbi:ATP/GTP-binding protein [Streptomyces sp. HNM0663]|uniref:ATP/GTP-binding protein n=1 Tax=Streptomyces chengmaiensis TaxID=3040919 RepID=A0ABT6HTL3_9ACTN|nr:ATP/GTP-binding protein [Streptomyces chengmaiensis]MDH2392066.1 ATP/GTP-binding protein [Streptomyces chengmaiensis]